MKSKESERAGSFIGMLEGLIGDESYKQMRKEYYASFDEEENFQERGEMTWREAIVKVLSESKEPLHYREITDRIIAEGLRKNYGATPAATVGAQITSSIKNDKDQSPFVRVGKGVFTLRKKMEKNIAIDEEEDEVECSERIITSFGMYWRRDAIEWKRKPKLLGVQQLGAEPVDFSEQIGIYLLYDDREVIYVGRSTERPLGRRLYEHTLDRLSTRWNRFSWFGLLPVDEKGKFGALSDTVKAEKIIPALEAILIEALEPRQNRRRGDDLEEVEYLQVRDPEVEKRR